MSAAKGQDDQRGEPQLPIGEVWLWALLLPLVLASYCALTFLNYWTAHGADRFRNHAFVGFTDTTVEIAILLIYIIVITFCHFIMFWIVAILVSDSVGLLVRFDPEFRRLKAKNRLVHFHDYNSDCEEYQKHHLYIFSLSALFFLARE